MAIIAVDFDGVLHNFREPKPGRRMGPPMLGAVESLQRLRTQGHYILIHSCNRTSVIRDWMNYYSIPFDSIWYDGGKPVCDYYIDDRAVGFSSWDQTMSILESL